MKKKKTKECEKEKLKLLPSLREKRHYLVIKSSGNVKEKIDKAILDYIGMLGYARAGPIYIDITKNYAIVSITTKFVRHIKAALVMKDIKCVGVSGTLKKLQRFLK